MPQMSLTPATRSDAAELIAANLASRAHHAPFVHPFTDWNGFQTWFATLLTGANVGLIARMPGEVGIVGVVTISQIVMGSFESGYLGYYGMAGKCGDGRMTEAVRQAVSHGFGALGLHRMEANIQPGNARSIALVLRLGFRREGYSPAYLKIAGAWRDHERWAILATDALG